MAADDAAVVVTLRANIKDYEAALKNAVRATERAATAADKALASVGKSRGGGNVIAANFQKSSQQIANDARILQFQLNDIFSGIASGQGVRAVQMQLGQIAQQLSGGGLAQGARTIGAAMVGMINPINLAVVAFGALATAAAAYFTSTEDDAKETAKAIKAQADLLRQVADAYGDALPDVKALADQLERISNMDKAVEATGIVIAEAYKPAREEIDNLDSSIKQFFHSIQNETPEAKEAVAGFADSWNGLKEQLEANKATSEDVKNVIVAALKAGAAETDPLIKALATIALNLEDVAKKAAVARANLIAMTHDPATGMGPGMFGPGVPGTTTTPFLPGSAPTPERRQDPYFADADRAAERAGERAKREAERAAEEAAERINKAIANQTKVAVDAVTGMLDMQENTNRSEINAFLKRGGVDLDAATTAWCAAFVNSALAQVGVTGSGSQVATSFMNWGRGVGLGSLQRGDVLVQGRGRAAGQTGGHVGFATGNVRTVGNQITEVEMISGNAAHKVTQEWVEASTVIARRATEAFELPAEALQHLQDESTAASTAAKKMAEDQLRAVQQLQQQYEQILGGGISSFVQDLLAGEDAGEAFSRMIQRMTGQIVDLMVQMLIVKPLMNSLFSGLGGGSVGLFEGGGTVGLSQGRPSGRRAPGIFANAPRYASGGMVGLKPGEVPIIAHRGEIIVPNARRLAGTGAGRVDNSVHQQNRINVDISQSGFVAANNDDAKAVGDQINRAVQVILVKESRPGGLLRRTPR